MLTISFEIFPYLTTVSLWWENGMDHNISLIIEFVKENVLETFVNNMESRYMSFLCVLKVFQG